MTGQLKAINFKILPTNNTYFGIVDKKTGRKKRIKKIIDELAKNYPSTKDRITQFWTDNQAEYDKLKDNDTLSHFKEFFNKFNGEEDIFNLFKDDAIAKLDGLFKSETSDSELIKAFKEVYTEQKTELSLFFDDTTGGVCKILFLIDLLKDFYLDQAPAYINEVLTNNNIKLDELDKDELKKLANNLLNKAHSTFSDTKHETDLNDLTEKLDTEIDNMEALIIETRKNKESNTQDDIDELKRDKAKLEKEKKDLETEKKDIIKTATEAATKITTLEADKKKLEKDLATEKAKPKAGVGGTGTTLPTIVGSDEWKATALFLTEPDFGKAMKYFDDLWARKWDNKQREIIYKILKANEENREWAEGKWGQHFSI